jgi:hypothetical protein
MPHRSMFHIADVMRGWSRSLRPVTAPPAWLDYDAGVTLSDIRGILTSAADGWRLLRVGRMKGVCWQPSGGSPSFSARYARHPTRRLTSEMVTLLGSEQPFAGWAGTL